jgi:hypothetical protein
MSSNDKRKIGSLRDLPREIAPPRDLWKGIEAEITADRQAVAVTPLRDSSRIVRLRVLAAAAVVAALGLGVWIGQWMYRPIYVANGTVLTPNNQAHPGADTADEPGAFHAAYVMGPKYINQRAQLVKDLETRLAQLPPDSRAKVLSSLQAINDSKRDLERELGKDPSNALLQELLVNTYQDEMRVLTAVHEAGSSGEGI